MSLLIKSLSVQVAGRKLLWDINLEIKPGTVHTLMGPNGSGKSTFAQVVMGNPNYQIENKKTKITIDGREIKDLKPEERAKQGLFLAFQNPVAISGVNVANLLRTIYQTKVVPRSSHFSSAKKKGQSFHHPALSFWKFNEILVKEAKRLNLSQGFLRRNLNENFSGGEKKKLEMLQALILKPKYAIFDEIDTGLDVDALRIVALGIYRLKKEKCGILLITHYQRILKFLKPDYVHVLVKGRIVDSGGKELAREIERKGYKKWLSSS